MLPRVCLGLALFAATPVWSQLGVIPYETASTAADDARMVTPPPVSVEAYPAVVRSEMRSNYLAGGLVFNTAYTDDVVVSGSTTPVRDIIYAVSPTIALDQTTSRRSLTLTYSPGFTFYQHNNVFNASDQNAALNFQYRLTQHTTFSVSDSFRMSSNVFNQLYPLSGAAISGSAQSPAAAVVAPNTRQLINTGDAGLSYQLSRNSMIGASGIVMERSYSNAAAAASDLSDSNSRGGSVFYSQRLSPTQYAGVTYQYLKSQTDPVNAQANSANAQSEVQTHTIVVFYTIYLNPTLSLSLSGGPQYLEAIQSPSPVFRTWTPYATASIGWQRNNTNFAASYSRTVTGSTGLSGAFDSSTTDASARWRMARTWIAGLAAGYATNKNITPFFSGSSPGGHSVSGTAWVQHSLSTHLMAKLGYAHLHQSYSGIAVISEAPNTNHEYISISYQLSRAIGR